MATSSDILKQIKKDHGPNIAKLGNVSYEDTPRLPTGVFPFDLASGGGFPMGKVSIVYGPESSNKTNLCLCAIAQGQKLYPNKKAVFMDIEHAFDPIWARKMGVNVDELILIQPEYAEQAADFLDSFVYAEDVFAIVVDSIAALSTQNETESSAEKVQVGGSALIVNKIFKKVSPAYNRMKNQGLLPPALICINQIRFKIGVMFGNPETLPGGMNQKFAASMIVRVYGKNVIDKKINPVMPALKEVSCIIQKWKVPILSQNCEYVMRMIAHDGQPPGYCNDWNTLLSYMKELDYISKGEKAGWMMFGEPYKTLDECRDHLYGTPTLLMEAKAAIIKEMLVRGGVGPSVEAEATE